MGINHDRIALLDRAAATLGALNHAADERAASVAGLGKGALAGRAASLRSRLERRIDSATVRLAELRADPKPSDAAVYGLAERAENIALQAERLRRAVSLAAPGPLDPRVWELEAADVMEAPARLQAVFEAAEVRADAGSAGLLARAGRLRDEVAAAGERAVEGAAQDAEGAALEALASAQRSLSELLQEAARTQLAPLLGWVLPRDEEAARYTITGVELTSAKNLFPPSAQASLALIPRRGEESLLTPRALQAWWAEMDNKWMRHEYRLATQRQRPLDAVEKVRRRRGPLAAAELERRLRDRDAGEGYFYQPTQLTTRARLRRTAHADAVGRRSPHLRRRRAVFWAVLVGSLMVGAGGIALPMLGAPPEFVLLFFVPVFALPFLNAYGRPPRGAGVRESRRRRRRLTDLRARLSSVVLDEDGTTLDAVLLASAGAVTDAPGPAGDAQGLPAAGAALAEERSLRAVAVRAWRELDRAESQALAVQRTQAFAERLKTLENLVDAIERRDEALALAAERTLAMPADDLA
ncbi:hypothetical protein [Galactobacter valiniphilus]|uniref:hypothetical protein n=1 Tax=Galactobacter valiniphilus TaxID=2676122 RepID=UPI0037353D88